eukprot:scaffold8621_cov67-Phaeocystis_antarctica.AAC.4
MVPPPRVSPSPPPSPRPSRARRSPQPPKSWMPPALSTPAVLPLATVGQVPPRAPQRPAELDVA